MLSQIESSSTKVSADVTKYSGLQHRIPAVVHPFNVKKVSLMHLIDSTAFPLVTDLGIALLLEGYLAAKASFISDFLSLPLQRISFNFELWKYIWLALKYSLQPIFHMRLSIFINIPFSALLRPMYLSILDKKKY